MSTGPSLERGDANFVSISHIELDKNHQSKVYRIEVSTQDVGLTWDWTSTCLPPNFTSLKIPISLLSKCNTHLASEASASEPGLFRYLAYCFPLLLWPKELIQVDWWKRLCACICSAPKNRLETLAFDNLTGWNGPVLKQQCSKLSFWEKVALQDFVGDDPDPHVGHVSHLLPQGRICILIK